VVSRSYTEEVHVPSDAPTAFIAAVAAMRAFLPDSAFDVDEEGLTVSAEAPSSARSFGEWVIITITPEGSGALVTAESSLSGPGSVSWGINRVNVRGFLARLEELLPVEGT